MAAVILQKTLPTPASTPRGDTISPQTPPRRIIQEFESGQGSAAQHAALIPSSHQQDEDSCRESSEGVAGGGQPYQACCEVAEESIPEQTAGAFPVATPKDCVLADTDGGPEHSAPQRDGRLSRQAAQVAATLISQQLDTPNYRPRKRKYAPEVSDASNATLTTASDAAVTGTESPGPDVPRLCDSPSPPSRNDNSHDNQSHLSRSDRRCIPVSPVASSLSSPSPLEIVGSPAPSPCEGQPSAPDVLPAEFAVLREDLRAKGPMIGNEETVEHLWHVVNYMKASDASPVGSDPSVEASSTSATDERLRVLKTCITREEQNEERLKSAKSLARLRKRVYLVELIGNYIDEKEVWNAWKAEPRRKRRKIGRRLSPLGRYTNLLFPETMGWKDTRSGTTKAALRQQAKNKLEYWVSLGEPLVMLARRYGVGVLAVLPKKMTDRGWVNPF